jgi:ATP-binding cassette subfamily C protein
VIDARPEAGRSGLARPVQSLLGLLDRRQRRQLGVLVALGLVNALLETGGAVAIYTLVNLVTKPSLARKTFGVRTLRGHLSGTSESGFLVIVALLIAAYYVVKNLSLLTEAFLQANLANTAASDVSRRLLVSYFVAPWSAISRRSSAELIRNATISTDLAFRSVMLAAMSLVSDVLIVVGILAVLFASAPLVTPVAAVSLGLMLYVVFRVLNKRFDRWGTEAQDLSEITLRIIQESLGGMKEVKVLGRERHFVGGYDTARARLATVYRWSATALQVPRLAIETMFVWVMVLIVALVALRGSAPTVVPLLSLYAYAGLRLLPSLNRMSNSLNNIRIGAPAVEVVAEDLRPATVSSPPAAELVPFRESIRLEGVSFRYPETEADVLREIDVELAKGDSLGIVGATGAGKSTLVDVMMGLLPPTKGRVLVDGRDIAGTESGWQRNLGYVPQTTFLIDDSLRRNIALGIADADINESQVADVVRTAQLDELISSLPQGLDTVVGERGVRLSGGQRQRISIARALYHEPDVLVFDEATSALDNRTEVELTAAIAQLGQTRTLLVIAHRMTSVRICRRIMFLDQGRVVDVDTYEDLFEHHATFRWMVAHADEAPSR